MVTSSTIATVTGVTLVSGLLGYAVYFDYKRRNDPHFRSRLRKDAKKTKRENKRREQERNRKADEFIKQTVAQLSRPGVLADGPERELTFSQEVQKGELLQAQGAEYALQAAASFYHALKVYPAPGELLLIYRQAVSPEVLDYVYRMVAADPTLNRSAADPMAGLARAAGAAASSGRLEEVDDEAPSAPSTTAAAPPTSSSSGATASNEGSAPSVSSQEWEKVSRTDEDEKRDDVSAVAAQSLELDPTVASHAGQAASDAATGSLPQTAPAAPPTS